MSTKAQVIETKLVDIAHARNDRNSGMRYFQAYHFDRAAWRMALAKDGNVYVDFVEAQRVVQMPMNAAVLDQLISDLQTMRKGQRKYHEQLRGAHLWIAQPHPTREGWLLVKHADAVAPFRPVRVGALRSRCGEQQGARAMPTCDGCRKPFSVGERVFEAEKNDVGRRPLGRARICVGCTQPPREKFAEIDGGR